MSSSSRRQSDKSKRHRKYKSNPEDPTNTTTYFITATDPPTLADWIFATTERGLQNIPPVVYDGAHALNDNATAAATDDELYYYQSVDRHWSAVHIPRNHNQYRVKQDIGRGEISIEDRTTNETLLSFDSRTHELIEGDDDICYSKTWGKYTGERVLNRHAQGY